MHLIQCTVEEQPQCIYNWKTDSMADGHSNSNNSIFNDVCQMHAIQHTNQKQEIPEWKTHSKAINQ